MRKLLNIIITIFLLLTNILHSEKVLKGKVKEYTEYVYDIEYKFGEPSKILKSSNKFVFVYDSEGNKIEKAYYKSDGSLYLKRKYKYKYDSKGNIIEKAGYQEETKFGEKQLILIEITEYKYIYYK